MKAPSRRTIIISITAVTLIAAIAVIAVRTASRIADTAAVGKAQAVAGAKSLAALDATTAASQFGAASRAFESAKGSLGPDWLAGVAGAIPWLGTQYTTARTLARIGADASEAGVALATALQDASHPSSSLDATGGFAARLVSDYARIGGPLKRLLDAADTASKLSTEGLLPQLAKAVGSLQTALREAGPLLARGRAGLPVISYLFSGSRRILVVSQNGAELRPTGGFAGSYGVMTFGVGGMRLEKYQDVYLLPDPVPGVPRPAGMLMANYLTFRDANWWIDFPTSARSMLGFWAIAKQAPVDGIIAIDTVAMQDVLAATGPVDVPGYKPAFASEDLLDRLLYLVEVKNGGSKTRKDVLGALATELEKRVLGADPAALVEVARSLGKASDEKHVQMYFTDPSAQTAADALGWSGRVSMPDGTTDLLAVSNAMNMGGKVNFAMRKTVLFEVGLRADRSADTTLVLTFANTGPYPNPIQLGPVFRDWLRVYRAPGVVFPSASPAGAKTMTVTEFGFPAEVRTFTLLRGESCTETFSATVPHALVEDAAQASSAGGVLHYRLRVIRQADLEDVPLTITVTVPPGSFVAGAEARFTASGDVVPVATTRGGVRMAIPLRGDLELDVRVAASR
jgi:hypothetical protein